MRLTPAEVHNVAFKKPSIGKRGYETRINTAFTAVIEACAGPRQGMPGTWITREMHEAYVLLHRRGLAHSIETWHAGRLVGGVLHRQRGCAGRRIRAAAANHRCDASAAHGR